MKRVMVAGTPGAWSSETLAGALRDLGTDSFVANTSELVHDLESGEVTRGGAPLGQLDAVVVKKLGDAYDHSTENRLLVLEEIERGGVTVFSSPRCMRDAVNRYRMSFLLRAAGLPMPRTRVTESTEAALSVVDEWGDVVLKPVFTSKGRGMVRLRSRSDAEPELAAWQMASRGPMYLQEFVPNAGRDLAVAVLGDEVVGSYYRVAEAGEWMTTTSAGGHYEPAEITRDVQTLALEAARVFGLAFTSVDMVESDGGWLVYEVSAFGGFTGLRDACGVHGAALYARYVMEMLS